MLKQLKESLFGDLKSPNLAFPPYDISRHGLICVAENGFAFSGTFAAGKPKDGKSAKEVKNSEKRKEDNRDKDSPTPPPLPRGKASSSSSFTPSAGFSHPMVPFLNPEECQRVILKRVPFVTRAVKCVSDAKGENFAVLQTHPANGERIVSIVVRHLRVILRGRTGGY